MFQESDAMRSLAEMADTLVQDYDVVDLLTGLADRCVELFGVSAAGVMLASPEGRLGLVASSSEAMRLLELFELQATKAPAWMPSVPGSASSSRTWRPSPAAGRRSPPPPSGEGFQSVSALPLRFRDITLGALNLFSVTQATMSEADVTAARAFTDLATLSIVQRRATAEAQRVNEQLSAALASRMVIEQATGLLAGRAGVDLAEAFSRLRAYARDSKLRLTDVAQATIAGTLDPMG